MGCLIVQLKGRAKIKPGTLWWLNSDDSLAVGQDDRVLDDSVLIFVHVNAAFRGQYLLQAFLCTWLGRQVVVRCGQEAWPHDYEGYNDAGSDHPYEDIIRAETGKGVRRNCPVSGEAISVVRGLWALHCRSRERGLAHGSLRE